MDYTFKPIIRLTMFHFLPCLNCISLYYAYPYNGEGVYVSEFNIKYTYSDFVLAGW